MIIEPAVYTDLLVEDEARQYTIHQRSKDDKVPIIPEPRVLKELQRQDQADCKHAVC